MTMRIVTAFALLLVACNSGSDAPAEEPVEGSGEVPVETEPAAEPAAEETTEEPTDSIRAAHEAQQHGAPVDPLPLPEGECTGISPTNAGQAAAAGSSIESPTLVGSARPSWLLQDVQPRSCGYESFYGLGDFDGPVLVVLLSAGCGYCLGQAARLDELWWEFKAEGRDVNIVIVNMAQQEERLSALTERTGLPIFQDTTEVNAWGNLGGHKDDFFYYGADGALVAYYSSHGAVETTLASDDGYGIARNTLLHLLGEDIELPMGGHSPHLPHGHH